MMLLSVGESLTVELEYDCSRGARTRYIVRPALAESPRIAQDRPVTATPRLRFQLRGTGEGGITERTLYLTNAPQLLRALMNYRDSLEETGRSISLGVLARSSQERVLQRPGMPVRLGYTPDAGEPLVPLDEQLTRLGDRKSLRVAVCHPFEDRFGDAILSLVVLRELRARLQARFPTVSIDLLHHGHNPETDRLYRRSGLVRSIRLLPLQLTSLAEYDAYFDFTRGRLRTDVHWLDEYLRFAGLDPADVPPSRKRMWIPPDPNTAARLDPQLRALEGGGSPVLLFHPQASTPLRSLSTSAAERFVREVLQRTDWRVASAVPLDIRDARFLDWSALSRSFDDFVYLVSRADMFVSVDTCMYHVADAVQVPGVVLFTTVRPEHRVAYYPYVEGVILPVPEGYSRPPDGFFPVDVPFAGWICGAREVQQVLDALERLLQQHRAARESGRR